MAPLIQETHLSSTDTATQPSKAAYMNGHASISPDSTAAMLSQIPSELPFGHRRKMKLAVVGAGLSGLNVFKMAEERLKNVEIVCYEKNRDIGGTYVTLHEIHQIVRLNSDVCWLAAGLRTDIPVAPATFPASHINCPGVENRGQNIVCIHHSEFRRMRTY